MLEVWPETPILPKSSGVARNPANGFPARLLDDLPGIASVLAHRTGLETVGWSADLTFDPPKM